MKFLKSLLEDEERTYPNPLPFISSDDPIFDDVFSGFDTAISNEIDRKGLRDEFNNLKTPRDRVEMSKRVRLAMMVKKSIAIKNIICTESMLHKEHLNRLVQHGNKKGRAVVAQHKGKYYVIDGNHRVVTAHLRKLLHIQVDLIITEN